MSDECCGFCRFWDGDKGIGRCRRYSPMALQEGQSGVWPIVSSSQWCGDYEASDIEDRSDKILVKLRCCPRCGILLGEKENTLRCLVCGFKFGPSMYIVGKRL